MMNAGTGGTELLAPGGSPESVRSAIAAGADAVYTGGSLFGARAYADNADTDTLFGLMDYCHLRGRKLYLTVNTLLKEEEIKKTLMGYLEPFYRRGLDAVLVQDFGVLRFLRAELPDLPVHASTQMSVSSVTGARMLQEAGVSRVVLARELTLREISAIADSTSIEIETFVHGALCYSYSGQCLMSSMIGGRSGNRGRCAQPCRQLYSCISRGEKAGKERCLLSLKDICTLEILPLLIRAGVSTFKIEGRMKRPEYAAGVTAIYRKYLDRILAGEQRFEADREDLRDLMDLYNRGGFSESFYLTEKGPEMMSMERPNHAGTEAAIVLPGNGKWKALEKLHPDDQLEIPENGKDSGRQEKRREQICPGKDVPENGIFYVKTRSFLQPGTKIRRVRNEALLKRIREASEASGCRTGVKGYFRIRSGEKVSLDVTCNLDGKAFHAEAEGALGETARTEGRGMQPEDFRKQLRKSGQTDFQFSSIEIDMEQGVFYPVSGLNALRREALEKLRLEILAYYCRPFPEETSCSRKCDRIMRTEREKTDNPAAEPGPASEPSQGINPAAEPGSYPGQETVTGGIWFSASAETLEQAAVLSRISGLKRIYLDCMIFGGPQEGEARKIAEKIRRGGVECFLMLPPVWREDSRKWFFSVFPDGAGSLFDGLLIRNFQQLGEKAFQGSYLITDESVYTWNRLSREQLRDWGAAADTLPSELNRKELAARGCGGSEMPVYGREILMTTTSCLQKNTAGCTRNNPVLSIRDRMGIVFPVRCLCDICTNRIYNSLPLDLSALAQEVRSLSPRSLRLRFTFENAKETESTVKRFLRMSDAAADAGAASTRGHFRRGVD